MPSFKGGINNFRSSKTAYDAAAEDNDCMLGSNGHQLAFTFRALSVGLESARKGV